MKQQAIVFTAPGRAELVEKPIPVPCPGQVVVQTAISTISSGTERANLVGEVNVGIYSYDTVAVFPRQSGYSSSGIVTAVGPGVTSVQVGDRVAMSWSLHQQFNRLPEGQVYRLAPEVGFGEAALWHIATFPLAAIRKCRLEMGESALVMGQGVLGMMAVKLLRAAGAVPVAAADPVPEKRAQALRLGADGAFDPFAPDFAEQVKALTGGVRVAIEVTGVGAGLDGALDCMAPMGRVALLGCTRHSDFSIDYYHKVHGPGISLIGAHTMARPGTDSSSGLWTTRDDVGAIAALVAGGRLEFGSMVQEVHSPAEASQVYGRLAAGNAFPLIQFDWSRLS